MTYKLIKVSQNYYSKIKDYKEELISNNSAFDGTGGLENFDDIEKWHLDLLLYEKHETCPPLMSLGFQYIYVDENDDVVGMVNIRPEAMSHPYLKQFGGHIGYGVLPSQRRKGIGTSMLKDALKICKDTFKLDKVLVTCFTENQGSRKVIEANGGVLESEAFFPAEGKSLCRFWIEL